jgi:hypothetical protein
MSNEEANAVPVSDESKEQEADGLKRLAGRKLDADDARPQEGFIPLGVGAGILTATLISICGWMISTVIDHKGQLHELQVKVQSEAEIKESIKALKKDIELAIMKLEGAQDLSDTRNSNNIKEVKRELQREITYLRQSLESIRGDNRLNSFLKGIKGTNTPFMTQPNSPLYKKSSGLK